MNSYFSADFADFSLLETEQIIGTLTTNSEFDVSKSQCDAWLSEIQLLKAALPEISGSVFLEFIVPRIGSRIDTVLIVGSAVLVVEFKVGSVSVNRDDINQVWDYALDLKNFHKGSHDAPIFPILVATNSVSRRIDLGTPHRDGVYGPLVCNSVGLASVIRACIAISVGEPLDPIAWCASPYQPTPTIIEAAQALYSRHSVDSIARHDAGARNLRLTSSTVEGIIESTSKNNRKAIIFVTGVPGAGKTLVGLNVATKKRDRSQPTHAVFLSGNGPLVAVLSEALARDEFRRMQQIGERTRKGEIRQKVKSFIQNVHHFRDDGLRNESAPSDHVVIFDEAQRAWNKEMTADFMRRKKGRPDFSQSEPEFLIDYLDRHTDWSVIICLVGGGQEINRGEAGISAWLEAAISRFSHWDIYVSPELTDTEYAAGEALTKLANRKNVFRDESLHLSVSMRSFRAETLSAFVKALLDLDSARATTFLRQLKERYPIVLTRNLANAKNWIRGMARGSERFGLVASSSAQRLKPHAIDVRVDIDPIHWFLSGNDDTRSSLYLEDAATEFQVQGLELDWVCMNWDADLRYANSNWTYHSFVGNKWNSVKKLDRQHYLRNAYRVLLTRARQGMVIFVPEGDSRDQTRSSAHYDPTFKFLSDIGIPTI